MWEDNINSWTSELNAVGFKWDYLGDLDMWEDNINTLASELNAIGFKWDLFKAKAMSGTSGQAISLTCHQAFWASYYLVGIPDSRHRRLKGGFRAIACENLHFIKFANYVVL
jgi:hypothetical protein